MNLGAGRRGSNPLCRRTGLVRKGIQRPNHFIADTTYCKFNLRRILKVFSHHLFENRAAEPFPGGRNYAGSAPFLSTENELVIAVGLQHRPIYVHAAGVV